MPRKLRRFDGDGVLALRLGWELPLESEVPEILRQAQSGRSRLQQLWRGVCTELSRWTDVRAPD